MGHVWHWAIPDVQKAFGALFGAEQQSLAPGHMGSSGRTRPSRVLRVLPVWSTTANPRLRKNGEDQCRRFNLYARRRTMAYLMS